MICENCKSKSECGYYSTNIEPVLHTEQGIFVNDNYLFALFKCLDAFTCEDYEFEAESDDEWIWLQFGCNLVAIWLQFGCKDRR